MSYDSRIIGIYNAYCERCAAGGVSGQPIDNFVAQVAQLVSASMDGEDNFVPDYLSDEDAFYIFETMPV